LNVYGARSEVEEEEQETLYPLLFESMQRAHAFQQKLLLLLPLLLLHRIEMERFEQASKQAGKKRQTGAIKISARHQQQQRAAGRER